LPDVGDQDPLDLLSKGYQLKGDSPWKWTLQITDGDLVGYREMDKKMIVMSADEIHSLMAGLAERSDAER
jgi:hypothetical protein